jgi:hypothetical protein
MRPTWTPTFPTYGRNVATVQISVKSLLLGYLLQLKSHAPPLASHAIMQVQASRNAKKILPILGKTAARSRG